ncbi:MAG: hypothetical protein CMN55_08115 [Sneathiella sp.]|jgi:hypothetical protein|uniref:DUF2333 family protein n=1 Tax=Sneathiella sp. TaxID=1964365 RepID=UPI000C4ABA37|nr:DUF2333 family protein [Sneathiella sp.]MAL79064.1 hypothetical protein [Sneathiella sp.]
MSEIGSNGTETKRLGRSTQAVKQGVKRSWKPVLLIFVLLLLLYYPIGMMMVHNVEDDTEFVPSGANVVAGGSHAVNMMAGLIDREINVNRWTANDPFFMPSSALDNMPNYQQGIISALARFSFELTDQIGRTRGSSQTDRDLQEAAGLLQYSGTKWAWDPTVSLLPTAASEEQYEKARASLISYNKRLAAGNAVFERRADNLLATLDRIALDIGSSTATIDKHIDENSGQIIDFHADDIFYGVKGQAYGYYMLLKSLYQDYEGLIKERGLINAWNQMLASFKSVIALDPFIVVNAAPDSQLLPNHLTAQGFYVLRARAQLQEISNILLK